MTKTEYKELLDLGVEEEAVEVYLNFSLPMLRKPSPRGSREWPHIEVGGDCLRIGKTTTKQVLVEQIGRRGYPLVFSDEDWKANKYLEDSYAEGSDSLLRSQIWFAKKKRAQLERMADSSFWIQVVNPEMDFGYAMTNYLMGRLTKFQLNEYWEFYKSLEWEKVPAPDLLVYLTAKNDLLVDRFKKTARSFEKADNLYIRVMRLVNQRWLELAKKQMPIMTVETDNFDYSYETGTQMKRDELGNVFFEKLVNEGWDL